MCFNGWLQSCTTNTWLKKCKRILKVQTKVEEKPFKRLTNKTGGGRFCEAHRLIVCPAFIYLMHFWNISIDILCSTVHSFFLVVLNVPWPTHRPGPWGGCGFSPQRTKPPWRNRWKCHQWCRREFQLRSAPSGRRLESNPCEKKKKGGWQATKWLEKTDHLKVLRVSTYINSLNILCFRFRLSGSTRPSVFPLWKW